MLIIAAVLSLGLQAAPTKPTELQVQGVFTDPLSGIDFETQQGDWERVRIVRYEDAPSQNHSVTYRVRNGVTRVTTGTVYVFPATSPAPDNTEVHLDSLLAVLSRAGRGYELVKKLPYTFQRAGVKHSSLLALFLFRGGVGESEEPRMEYLFLIKEESYWIKWRFTTIGAAEKPLSKSTEELDQILGLVQELLPVLPKN